MRHDDARSLLRAI
jgi:hypothetical protein